MKVLLLLCKGLDLRVARGSRKMAVPSPVGDLKIVSSISTFVLNTLTLTCCVGSHTLLHVVGCCYVLLRVVACCCVLLRVVGCCCVLLHKV